jgi:hypothetical protein
MRPSEIFLRVPSRVENAHGRREGNIRLAGLWDLGGGQSAYFESGSFKLIVIPEPSVCALMSVFLLAAFRRRRSLVGGRFGRADKLLKGKAGGMGPSRRMSFREAKNAAGVTGGVF